MRTEREASRYAILFVGTFLLFVGFRITLGLFDEEPDGRFVVVAKKMDSSQ